MLKLHLINLERLLKHHWYFPETPKNFLELLANSLIKLSKTEQFLNNHKNVTSERLLKHPWNVNETPINLLKLSLNHNETSKKHPWNIQETPLKLSSYTNEQNDYTHTDLVTLSLLELLIAANNWLNVNAYHSQDLYQVLLGLYLCRRWTVEFKGIT